MITTVKCFYVDKHWAACAASWLTFCGVCHAGSWGERAVCIRTET